MSSQRSDDAAAVMRRLRMALEETAAALAHPQLESMLACETLLQAASGETGSLTTLAAADHQRIGEEIDRARAALMRCRRLGDSLEDFVRASLEAHGGSAGYGPRPADVAATVGRAFTARG